MYNNNVHVCPKYPKTCVYLLYVGEVIFDRNHPKHPPDVIFSAEDDQMSFDPDIEKLTVRQLN